MAIVGGALLPVATAALADRIGIHHSFVIPAVCYLYILYYALSGSRPTAYAARAARVTPAKILPPRFALEESGP